jgi:hypothetical protein
MIFLLFRVGQSYDSFTLLSVKDVLFQHCQQAIKVMDTGYRQGGALKHTLVFMHERQAKKFF